MCVYLAANSVSDIGLDGITSKCATKTNINELAMRTLTTSYTNSPLHFSRNPIVVSKWLLEGEKGPERYI